MENSMAKSMAERYEDYLNTTNLEERAVKNIYYWVMSTIESFFWGRGRTACPELMLYADTQRMVLNFKEPTGRVHQSFYCSTQKCDDSDLPVRLQEFVKVFNNTDSHLSQVFRAYYHKDTENSVLRVVSFHINMLPGTDEPTHYNIA